MKPRLWLIKEQNDTLFVRQIPPFGTNTRIGDYDYSNEMKALGVNLDMLKERAEDVIKAYRHSLSTKSDGSSPFDPAVTLHLQ